MSRHLLDTNILLRFLSGQPPAQASAARKLFVRAAAGELTLDVSPVIVAEAFYTLHSFYAVDRKTAASQLSLLLQQSGVKVREADQVLAALEQMQHSNIGFADAFLAAGATKEDVPIASFDRDFDRLDVKRYEPTA